MGNPQTRTELLRQRKAEEHASWAPSLSSYMPGPQPQIVRGDARTVGYADWGARWRGALAERGLRI